MKWFKKIDKWLWQLLAIELIGLLAIYFAFKKG